MGECEICGRRLVTGRKYCYEHRGYRGEDRGSNIRDSILPLMIFFIVAIFLFYLLMQWFKISPLTASLSVSIIMVLLIGRFLFKGSNLKYLDWIIIVFIVFLFIYLSTKVDNPKDMVYVIIFLFGLFFVYFSIIFWKNKENIKKRNKERSERFKNKLKGF